MTALAVFLLRQPASIAIKALSGRRSPRDFPSARFWMLVYGFIGLLSVSYLVWQGFAYLLILALPGIPVFAWHLRLISQRAERRQVGVELVGSGVLALSAPAAYWVGIGHPDPTGWWLFILAWFQSAASIVYAYLRLEQRTLTEMPSTGERLRMARRALLYTSFNLLSVTILSVLAILPPLIPLPFAIQWVETIWGTLQPAVGVKPTRIGMRQLLVSSLFTLVFIMVWR